MQATSLTSTTPGPAVVANKDISPLDLPETLSRILSFVDQTTLRTSAVLVSRLWLVTCRYQLVRELTWEECFSYRGEARILKRLPYVSRLCWIVQTRPSPLYTSPEVKAFKSLVQELKDIQERQIVSPSAHSEHAEQQEADNKRSLVCTKRSLVLIPRTLQELVLTVRLGGLERFTTLAPYLFTLTELRLQQFLEGTMQVGSILQACPHLRVLHLTAHHTLNLLAPWHAPPLDSDNLATTTTTTDDRPQLMVPLTTLVLENARFIQQEFEQFLSSTPHLRVLKLIKLQKVGHPSTFAGQIQYDCSRLINHLQRLNLQLRAFHLSVYDDPAANAAIEEMMTMTTTSYGSSSEWNFAADVSPTALKRGHQSDFPQPNRVSL
ncbi:hypothetical protein BG015_009584 [Linnemannia schmuckeri]|uniref:F-box domain-containing protein n=1 Tax=Linnemannia schmuckeri TaxID=64567 RepID=A0A9P5V9N9_9FUNG|nr:hypothetical protein BG015_009584 [Linnemannia schmuckeri]